MRGNPVLWREQKVEGIAPLVFLRRWPRWLGMAAVMIASAASLIYLLLEHLPPAPAPGPGLPAPVLDLWTVMETGRVASLLGDMMPIAGTAFYFHGFGAILVLSTIVAIRSSGSIVGEKERGTWQALLLTPLTTQKIVTGKQWGIFWASMPYLAAHTAVALPLAIILGVEATAWAVLWIGAMLLAVILGGAIGLYWSARAGNSWKSLLATLASFYVFWFLAIVPAAIVLVIAKSLILIFLKLEGLVKDNTGALIFMASIDVKAWAACLGLPLAFWYLNSRLIAAAVRRVGRNDRSLATGFDYYYIYNDYLRGKLKEPPTPRVFENQQTDAVDVGEAKEAPIPFLK